ncbi:hypothetical protein BH11PAT3_BH11PAT3_0900 [soil metagenome]
MSEVLLEHPVSKKGFLDFFPAPKFLLLSTVGLSFSDIGVQSVEFKQSPLPRQLELARSIEVPFPEGVIVLGYINDKPTVVKILSELKTKYSLSYIKATLPEEKAYLFTVEIQTEPFASLRDRVAFTVEENAPVSLSTSIFDFEIIGNVMGKAVVKVAVSVLPKKVVETYIEVCESAGLVPVSFEVESQAIARAIVKRGDCRPQLVVNMQNEKTGLYVVEDEIVQFSSTPAFGVRLVDGVYPDIVSLKNEIRKVFAYWNTRLDKEGKPQQKIERVLLTGRGAANKDFVRALMEDIDIEHVLANVWINALPHHQNTTPVESPESLMYSAAIGVALLDKEPTYV